MKQESELAKRIKGSINTIEKNYFLSGSDKIRYATIIEAYLFAVDYFNEENKSIYDYCLKEKKKFLFWEWEEIESFVDCMIRHGKIYLIKSNFV